MDRKGMCKRCYWIFCQCKNFKYKQQKKEEEDMKKKEDNISSYDLSIVKIGEVTNAVVYKCINLVTNKYVALKKIQLKKHEIVPSTTIHEISLMRELQHPNIVSLIYMNMNLECSNQIELVYEFLPMDLNKYMETLPHGQLLDTQLVKTYLHQIIQGFFCSSLSPFCHIKSFSS